MEPSDLLGDRVIRIAKNQCNIDDYVFQANLYKDDIAKFVIECANKKFFYCILCQQDTPIVDPRMEYRLNVERKVLEHIIEWLQYQKFKIFDSKDQSCVLIRLQ